MENFENRDSSNIDQGHWQPDSWAYRVFSPNVTEFPNNETLAKLPYKTNPVGLFC